MSTGTGNLPYPGKSYSPFDILTAEELNEDVANIESLADGSGVGDAAITASKIDFTTFAVANGYTYGWKSTNMLANQGSIGTTATVLTGSSQSITVPAGAKVKISFVLHIGRTDSANLADCHIRRDGSNISSYRLAVPSTQLNSFSGSYIDDPGAGTYTYDMTALRNSATGSGTISNNVSGTFTPLIIYELVT